MTDLEATILNLVRDLNPCHGLAIADEYEGREQKKLAIGTLYKTLHRLERDGYITARWETDGEGPAHRGPRRRYYALQAPGLMALSEHASALEHRLRQLRWSAT